MSRSAKIKDSISIAEMEKLLEITSLISSSKSQFDLLKNIIQATKPLFNFIDCGLFVLSKDGTTHCDWAALYPDLHPSEWNEKIGNAMYREGQQFPNANSPVEWLMNKVDEINAPLLADFVDLYSNFPTYHQFQYAKLNGIDLLKLGYRDCLAYNLKENGKNIGFFCINATAKNFFKESQFPLFKAITNIIAVAVSNILHNQEIVAREKEKDVLLFISQKLNNVKKVDEVLQIIIEEVKPIFNFYDTGIILINEANGTYCDLSVIYPTIDNSDVNYSLKDKGYYDKQHHTLENSVVKWIIEKLDGITNSLLFNYLDDYSSFSDADLLNDLKNDGYVLGWMYPLLKQGKVFGFLSLNYKVKSDRPEGKENLFISLANRISTSLSNIFATEEIEENNNIKTRLLEITEDITTSNTEIDLIKVIVEKIKPIFNFHDCGLFVLSDDGQTHSDWAATYDYISPSELNNKLVGMPEMVVHKNSLIDFLINEIEKQNNSVLFDFVDFVKLYPKYPQLDGTGVLEMGYRDCLMYNLKSEGKIIGCFCINALAKDFFKASQFELFKSVTNIIAIAVKNIITNESLAKVATIKSLEVEIIKRLANSTHWQERLLEVNKLLQPYIPNSLLLVSFEMKENKCPMYAYLRTGFSEYQTLMKDDILNIVKMDSDTFLKTRSNLLKTYQNPFILEGKSLIEHNKNNTIKGQICSFFGFTSIFIYPLHLEKYGKVVFSFFGKEEIDFIEKHIQLFKNVESTLRLVFDRILASEEIEHLNNQLAQENSYLQEEVNSKNNFESIIGSSSVLQEVFKNVDLVANTDTTVLVLGETGTGKELIARSLHNLSRRKTHSLIKVNCAALPAQLIESELFGHEKGSFTGAFEKRIGKFELADNGSIFLDEIGELPLELQAKLLRVIQEKEFERIGGKETIKCNVRIIAATNRVLETEVEKGRFRADLYFRLNVFPIKLPSLQERKEDIPLLATYFGQKFSKKMNKPFKGIQPAMLEALIAYQWPGNIRELENVMEQAVIVNQGNNSLELARQLLFIKQPFEVTNPSLTNNETVTKSFKDVKKEKEMIERNTIIETLTATKGRVRGAKGAALLLDIQPTSLESKMKKYGIIKDEFGMLGQ